MKFSIIVPVYNGEKHILKNLESLKNQTYKNFEIIIVNDGSTDKTEEVLYDFFEKNQEIEYKLIKTENRGVTHARQVAMKHISGEFFCNLDADDYLDRSTLDEVLKQGDFDVCFYGWITVDENHKKTGEYKELFKYIDNTKKGIELAELKLKRKIWICQGNAFYKTKFIRDNSIGYPKGINYGEDLYFITTALIKAKIVKCIKKDLFYCMERQESAIRSKFNKLHLDAFKAVDVLEDFIVNEDLDLDEKEKLKRLVKIEYINNLFWVIEKIISSDRALSTGQIYKNIMDLKLKKIPINKLGKEISFKRKVKIFLWYKVPFIYILGVKKLVL